jgi:hypothetical protein
MLVNLVKTGKKATFARTSRVFCCAALALAALAGCAPMTPAPAFGSRHEVRLSQPPAQAAQCFARNAEAHSSALESEVRQSGRGMQVIVRVKNGVTYATADIDGHGGGSIARIDLNVVSTGGASDLVSRLTEGC